MIIKRWNGSAFVKEFPETKAQLIRNNTDTGYIFDGSDKIYPTYLPDSVFDGLKFYAAVSGAVGSLATRLVLASALLDAKEDALTANGGVPRSITGYYFVISTAGTITGLTAIEETVSSPGTYVTLQFRPQDGGANSTANTSSGALEVGDWFVIESITGAGTLASPYVFTAAVINNTYENATTAIDGIVRLSSRTTYASLSGNNVVTEGVLKTVVDEASFAASGHLHGNISNAGVVSTNTAASSGQHLVITNTSDLIQQSAITLGTGTTTFLRNDGTWGTPVDTNTTYSAATASVLGLVELFSDTQQSVAANAVSATASRTYGIQLNSSNQAVVNVPWSDTNTTYSAGTGLSLTGTVFANTAPDQTVALTGAGATTISGTYPNFTITSTDTNTTYGIATSSTAGLVEVFSDTDQSVAANTVSTTAGRTYGIQLNAANQAVVNVPWTDTNTVATATALGGLSVSSNSFQMVHPFFVQASEPTTPLTGTIWFDI